MEITVVSLVSWLALGSSIFLYLTGGKACWDIIKNNSIGSVTLFPYVSTCISSTVMLKYGILTNNQTILIVNTFGSTMQLVYICIYYHYLRDRSKVNRILMLSASFVYSVLFYAKYVAPSDRAAAIHLGLLGSFLGIMMTASPLISVAEVVRTKCTESMAFPFVFVCFLCCVLWALFGLLIKDIFVIVPNVVGSVLGIFQLSLFVLYPSKRRKPVTENETLESPLTQT